MPHRLPKYVRVKRAKGRTYYYFDTGQQDDSGKAIHSRLPDLKHPGFSRAVSMAQAARERREATPHVLTFNALANLYEKSPKFRKLAPASQELYTLYLRQAREFIGIAPADDVDPSDVRVMRDRMADRPAAANAMIRAVAALYKWGRGMKHVTVEPCKEVELFDQGEHQPWPDWLVTEALAAEDALVRRGTALLYFTAQRIGDVCAMRWSDVRDKRIELVQQKTGTTMSIPVHRALQAILDEDRPKGLTILARDDGAPVKMATLRVALQRWAEKKGQKVVPHGLRKNAVNALLEAGCSAAEVAAISGQSLQMVEHYAKQRDKKHLGSAAILRWERAANKTGKRKRK